MATLPMNSIPREVAKKAKQIEKKNKIRSNHGGDLEKCDWKTYGNKGAAELLGISPTTLTSRMKRFKIRKPPSPRASPDQGE